MVRHQLVGHVVVGHVVVRVGVAMTSLLGICRRAVPPAAARVLALTAALALSAAVLDLAWVDAFAAVPAGVRVPWLLLAALFAATEVFVVHLHFRSETQSLSLSEIPLVLGLMFGTPLGLVLARLLGSGVALVVHRRQRPLKLAVNLGYFWLETSLALVVFHRVLGGAPAGGPRGWFAAFAAAAAAGLVGVLVVPVAISLHEGRVRADMVPKALGAGVVATTMNTSLALVAAVALSADVRAGTLLAVVAVLLFTAYRGYATLRERHDNQEMLHAFTREIGVAADFESVVTTLLPRVRDLLRAETAELRLTAAADGDSGLCLTAATDGAQRLERPVARAVLDDVTADVVARGEAVLLARSTRDRRLRRWLRDRRLRDAMVAPLHSGAGASGVLVVGNRLGDVTTFGKADLQAFETLANHASVALENGRLVDRLRLEAAEKEHQALHDSLTGLANRTLFGRRVQQAIAAAGSDGASVAVMLMDLDRFKDVNDTLGHHVGDLLLQQIGARLDEALRGSGTMARLGGDEFAVCLPRAGDDAAAVAVAGRLQAALCRPFALQGMTLDVGASIGIALCPQHGSDASTLLKRADVAMYAAKTSQSATQVYAPDRDDYSPRRLALVGELRRAIDAGELAVHYQPKADLATGAVTGVEALVRWHHPRHGFIPPDEFIPLAEHTGLIHALTRYVLRAALRQCRAWQLAGLHLDVAVNLSARSLAAGDLAGQIRALLDGAGVAASSLTLELTESSIMADPARTTAVLARLSQMGVRLAIDDYGTGYSALSYLKRLPVDEMKIDRSFICNMTGDDNDAVIVRSTIDLGRNLGLRVVAEGVEDDATWTQLRALGCDVAQGYLLTRPLTAARLEDWLVAWETRQRNGWPPAPAPATRPPLAPAPSAA